MNYDENETFVEKIKDLFWDFDTAQYFLIPLGMVLGIVICYIEAL